MAKKIVLDENTSILVITAAIALATLAISSAIYNSHASKVKELRSGIDEEAQRLVMRKDIAKLDDIIKEYKKYIYKDISTYALRDTISALARDTGVDIISIQPAESEKLVNYTKIYYRVRLNCTYNQLGKFIERLEGLHALTKVDEIATAEKSGDYRVGSSRKTPQGREFETEVSLTISAYCLGSLTSEGIPWKGKT